MLSGHHRKDESPSSAQEGEVVEAGGIKAFWLRDHRHPETDIGPGLIVVGHLKNHFMYKHI